MTDTVSATEGQEPIAPEFVPGDVVRLRGIPGPLMVVDLCPDPDVEDLTVVMWFSTMNAMQTASIQTRLLERAAYQMTWLGVGP